MRILLYLGVEYSVKKKKKKSALNFQKEKNKQKITKFEKKDKEGKNQRATTRTLRKQHLKYITLTHIQTSSVSAPKHNNT